MTNNVKIHMTLFQIGILMTIIILLFRRKNTSKGTLMYSRGLLKYYSKNIGKTLKMLIFTSQLLR